MIDGNVAHRTNLSERCVGCNLPGLLCVDLLIFLKINERNLRRQDKVPGPRNFQSPFSASFYLALGPVSRISNAT
jgi:hypothetical protein